MYLLSLSLVLLGLSSWLVLPASFPIAPRLAVSAPTAMTFTVTRTGDVGVLCPPGEPTCTLRSAINAANSNPGIDTIRFQITGTNPIKTIDLASALPAITEPVTIDGTSQPGYDGHPLIELNGANAGAGANGLTITGGATLVKGLIINRFSGDGISVSGGNNNTFQSNYIGTDAAGNVDLGNGLNGVRLRSALNLIGGLTGNERNVISGNGGAGVVINGTNATDNELRTNYIGTNAAGNAALGNTNGVFVSGGANNNTIGGLASGAGNVISGNSNGSGVEIRDITSTGNKVQGNLIGTDSSGRFSIPNNTGVTLFSAGGQIIGGDTSSARNIISGNAGSGVFLSSNGVATRNQVGDNLIGLNLNGDPLGNNSCGIAITGDNSTISSNTIAFNHNDGICVLAGTGNLILTNRIFSNSRLGIDLGPEDVTANDTGDADTGANNLQNFPLLTSAVLSGGNVTVRGTLNSTPNSSFSILVFSNSECDPSGNGEGENSFGIASGITTDANGNASFTVQGPPLPLGSFLTASAIKLVGGVGFESSEFSPCRQMTRAGTLSFSAASYNVNEGEGPATITINRTNGSDGTIGCLFTTSNSTATSPQDYTDTDVMVFFAPGQTSRTIAVPIIDDTLPESTETVSLNLSSPTGDATIGTPSGAALNIIDNDSGAMVQLGSTIFSGSEDCAPVVVTVDRLGDTSGVSTVDYLTASGTASDRTDFTAASGTLRFGPGEAQKTFVVLINEDSLTEGDETASITLSHPVGAGLTSPSVAILLIHDDSTEPATNANDDSAKFVCQHYHDFLNRQPDASGEAFWTNEIESCGTDAHCREIKRINVSAAFFLSIEFQQTGYLVYRMYKVAYGNMPGAPVPLTLGEFLPDTQAVGQGVQVGIGDWEAQLENNKNAFAAQFVARPRFTTLFPPSMTAAQFVDLLNLNSGGALSVTERNQLVNDLATGAKTRAQVLRAVAEDQTLKDAEFNRAFVLMQYFGYLRRNPNDIPDADFSGYNFWLNKLNEFGGNFINADMVKSFLVAGEYRHRFGS
jgi:hypothetical protein